MSAVDFIRHRDEVPIGHVTLFPLERYFRPACGRHPSPKGTSIKVMPTLIIVESSFQSLQQLGELDQIEAPAFADVHRSSDASLSYEDQFTLYLSTFKPLNIIQVIDRDFA